MKVLISSFLIIVLFTSCGDDIPSFDSIPIDKYYTEDPLEIIDIPFTNGVWKAIDKGTGATSGLISVPADFDYLKIKPNGIFAIEIQNKTVATGKIEIVDSSTKKISLIPENDGLDIDIINSNNRSISLNFSSENNNLLLFYSTAYTRLERVN